MQLSKWNTSLFVLDTHLGGTSAVGEALALLGTPPRQDRTPQHSYNREAAVKNQPIEDFNKRKLLPSLGSSWDDLNFIPDSRFNDPLLQPLYEEAHELILKQYQHGPAPVFHDPLNCLLFPFWRRVLESFGRPVAAILLIRAPLDVALSLNANDKLSIEKGLLL